ncbi:MAG: D-cysteine desulfhydrase [Oceanicoccus sp.]|jgi:D-cysteine desulfhydrase
MTGSAVSGNKIRKLEFTLAKALADGCDTVITCGGVQSNHCRTTAILCAQLGLKCHLILRGSKSEPVDGNLFLDHLVDAQISFYKEAEFKRRGNEIYKEWQQHYADLGHKAMIIPVGASDGVGLWGYVACCAELKADFAKHSISPSAIVSATGSGGTQGGLTAGNALYELGAEVYGINVCDDEAYFLKKVHEDLCQWQQAYADILPAGFDVEKLSINVIDGYVGPGYAQATEQVFDTIKRAARLEGLVLDPVYTAKGFFGLIDQIQQGRFADSKDIVFIHTGGIFGLLAQREQVF